MFTFNNDYHDLDQVAQWLPEFSAIREEIVSAGRYPYNDDFKGRIPGIANTEKHGRNSGTHEEAAIYLLQGLYRRGEAERRIASALAEGFEPLETLALDRVEKFSRVILYKLDRGGDWHEYESARLVPETNPNQRAVTGAIRALIPKGKRTHGVYVAGYSVLVKRDAKEGKTLA